MRKILLIITFALLMSVAFTACRTTEANYKEAYIKALEKKNEGLTHEELSGFHSELIAKKTLYKGDSIPYRSAYVKLIDGGADSKLLTYNIIVASFRQKFNANSAYTRLKDAGYERAALMIGRDNQYYVASTTISTMDSAVAIWKDLNANLNKFPIRIQEPYPYIMRR